MGADGGFRFQRKALSLWAGKIHSPIDYRAVGELSAPQLIGRSVRQTHREQRKAVIMNSQFVHFSRAVKLFLICFTILSCNNPVDSEEPT